LVREHNEDNFLIANLTNGERGEREASLTDVVGEGGLLFAVCDGMGGAAAGEVASQMAVDVLDEVMRRGGSPKERDVLARRLVSAVEEAGRRIFDSAQKERSRRGMGTTATAAVLIDKVLFVAEVGDSRAYLLRNGQLKQLTKDQSLVNQLIEAGHLTEAEAEAFEHSNIILQALGTSETVQVDLTFVELRRGDRLMLCSDGLSGLVSADTLRDTLTAFDDPAECTAALIRHAEASGGHDNITVVVTDFDGEDLELPRETDSFGYLQYPLVPAAHAASTFADEETTDANKLQVGFNGFDPLPAYTPPAGPRVDSSPWVWVSAGLTALLLGAWLLAMGDTAGSATAARDAVPAEDDSPLEPVAPSVAPSIAAPGTDPALDTEKPVSVLVHTDVDDALLLINGEARGPLVKGQEQALALPPGQYHFEAQSHGAVAVAKDVNVEPASAADHAAAPLDVNLDLPAGSAVPAKAQAAQAKAAVTAPTPSTVSTTPAAPMNPAAPTLAIEPPSKPVQEGPAKALDDAAAKRSVAAAVPTSPQPVPAPGATGPATSVAKAPAQAAARPPAAGPAAAPKKPVAPTVVPVPPKPAVEVPASVPKAAAPSPAGPTQLQAPKAVSPANPVPAKPAAPATTADRPAGNSIPDNPF
jgi:serine/threonine protein phosphatase PrpC